jgi:hypothetical protein
LRRRLVPSDDCGCVAPQAALNRPKPAPQASGLVV